MLLAIVSVPSEVLPVLNMSRVQKLRLFVNQRLNEALEEILAAFEKIIVKYEQEAALSLEVISRQHALLCALRSPLMELPSADVFTHQLQVKKEAVPPIHLDVNPDLNLNLEPSHVKEEQDREQLRDLDEADIIQFTYSSRCAVRSGEDLDFPTKPEPADPDQDVQVVLSSETEDSEDYSKDPNDPTLSPTSDKPQTAYRPGSRISCRVCSRTFKAYRFLLRHVKTHLQEAQKACGLCGKRFEADDSLKFHLQTHRRRTEQQYQTRTRSRKRRVQLDSEDQKPKSCDDHRKMFLRVMK